jgi:hypothetical protein
LCILIECLIGESIDQLSKSNLACYLEFALRSEA